MNQVITPIQYYNMDNLDIKNFQPYSSVEDNDYVLLVKVNGTDGRISVSLLRSQLGSEVKPSIVDGMWHIGKTNTNIPAEGETPVFRASSAGIEYKYEKETEENWRPLVGYDVLKLKFSDLTPEQKQELKMRLSDLTPAEIAELQRPAAESVANIIKTDGEVKRAEALRVDAEQNRVAAEKDRVTEHGALVTATNSAKDAATAETVKTVQATKDAVAATGLLNEVIEDTVAAAELAAEAAGSVDAIKKSTEDAKNKTIEATNAALETATHPTYVDADFFFYRWNSAVKAYEKTDIYVRGDKGEKGDIGQKGDKGDTGATGATGQKGDKGDKGEQGSTSFDALTPEQKAELKGEAGAPGTKGDTGATGAPGQKGDKGDKGDQGIQGVQGERGYTGMTGATGIKGDKGNAGQQGVPGQKGDKGDTGQSGAPGVKGDKGDKGDIGNSGSNGVSCTHSWNGTELVITSASGSSSANLKGDKGDKGDIGAQGAKGEPGAPGQKGDIGVSGAPGQKGDKGDAGLQGERGYTGATGAQGVPGQKGDKGDKGDKGEQGIPGIQGERGYTGSQGSTGVQGATGAQGTPGQKGDKGDKGDTGAQGIGDPTVSGVNTVYTLTSLPVNKRSITAALVSATNISLAANMSIGQEIYIRCVAAESFTQPIPAAYPWTSMNGNSVDLLIGDVFEISIWCYDTGVYSISIKMKE